MQNYEFKEYKCSLLGGGQGKVSIINDNIVWKKSMSNFLAGGLLAFMTKRDQVIEIKNIIHMETCSIVGSAGIQIFTNQGKRFKFGFVNKKERDDFLFILNNKINNNSN